jgi:hypothetical protein
MRRRNGSANEVRSHVTSSCLRPPPRSCINMPLRRCRGFNSVAYVSVMNYSMARLFVFASRLRSRPDWLSPPLPWPDSNWTFMLIVAPDTSPGTLPLVFIHSTNLMPRQRGRPRRGSPWKPRRPSVSPPESPFHLLLSAPPARASSSCLPHTVCIPV